MPVKVILGLQHGDEGKGRVVDDLTNTWADVIVRFQGGGNAGHTVYDEKGNKHVTHILPVGILNKDKLNIISKGCVIDLHDIVNEINEFNVNFENLKISSLCPLIEPLHLLKDKIKYKNKIGTTAKGIGPAYSDFYSRDSVLLRDFIEDPKKIVYVFAKKLNDYINYIHRMYLFKKESFKEEIINSLKLMNYYLENYQKIKDFIEKFVCYDDFIVPSLINKNILIEGAQGSGLCINTSNYPNVTSSYATIGGVLNSTNLNHTQIDEVIGVIKAYKTKVGEGDFKSICDIETEELLCELGKEYGATTGRKRKCGWLDLDEVVEAVKINGVSHICLIKLDVFSKVKEPKIYFNNDFHELKSISNLNENDEGIKDIINLIKLKTKVNKVSYTTGPKRGQIIWNK